MYNRRDELKERKDTSDLSYYTYRKERESGSQGVKILIINIVLILFMAGLLLLIKPTPTGFVVVENLYNHTQNLNLEMNQSSETTWFLEHPNNLKSVRISGNIAPEGSAKAYIEYKNRLYLIFDSDRLKGEGLVSITGLVISNDTTENNQINETNPTNETNQSLENASTINQTNETIPKNETIINKTNITKIIEINLEYNTETLFDEDNDGRETITGAIDFTVENTEFNWNVNESNLCTQWEVYSLDNDESVTLCYGADKCCNLVNLAPTTDDWDGAFYLTYEKYGTLSNNKVGAQIIYADYSLDLENAYSYIYYSDWQELNAEFYQERIEFNDICIETCLVDFNQSFYKLIFEIENSSLTIETVSYSVIEKRINHQPEFSLISDIEMIMNSNITINLSSYAYDKDNDSLTFKSSETEKVTVIIKEELATISPDINFTGNLYLYFMVSDGMSTILSNIITIDVKEGILNLGKIRNVSEETKTGSVVINKQVKWTKKIVLPEKRKISINISPEASNISIKKIVDGYYLDVEAKISDMGVIKELDDYNIEKETEKIDEKIENLNDKKRNRKKPLSNLDIKNINQEIIDLTNEKNKITGYAVSGYKGKGIITRFFEWLFKPKITGYAVAIAPDNITAIIIDEPVDEIIIEYYTEGPVSEENIVSESKKQIVISSDIHYENITAFTVLPVEAPANSVRLYWLVNNSKINIPVNKSDTNNNGLIDYIEWIVPSLSNQTYEVEILILNVQSYPSVGGEWTVLFDTTGMANLTIRASNGTTWSNYSESGYDLKSLEVKCGNQSLDYDFIGNGCSISGNCSVFIEDYSCNSTGHETSKVLTRGEHILEFGFGWQIVYAKNFASDDISIVDPTPANNSQVSVNYVYVNITATENLNQSLLEWVNVSGLTNMTMANISGTDWYVNMTNLVDGKYNFTVWAQNRSGVWNQSVRRFVTVDLTYPTIDFVAPTPDNNTHTVNDFVVVNVSMTELNLDEFKWEWNNTNYTFYDDSLILMYNFDNVSALGENDTFVKDLSIYGNDGVVQGNVTLTGPSKYGGSFTFNPDSQTGIVNVTNDQAFNFTNKSFTISHWTYGNYYTGVRWAGVVAKVDSDGGYITGWAGDGGGQRFRLYIGDETFNNYMTSFGSIPDFEWTHFTAVYNFSNNASERTIELYINGVLNANFSSVAIPTITSTNPVIGRDGEGGTFIFNGSIDNVMIWNRSLSMGEVQQLYYSNLNKYDVDKWAFYTNQTNLTDGSSFVYAAHAKDIAGNWNSTETRNITIDTTYPTIDFVDPTPANNSFVNSFVANISMTELNLDEFKWEWNNTNYTIYDDSLVLFMNFDNVSALGENSTLVKDLSGYGNDGIVTYDTAWNSTGGKYGGSYKFDGDSSDYPYGNEIIVSNDDSLNINASESGLTVVMWARIDDVSKSKKFLKKGGFEFRTQGSPQWQYACSKGWQVIAAPVQEGNWTHIAITANESGVTTYENGAKILFHEGDNCTSISSSDLYIGGIALDGSIMNGSIDDLMIFNRSLSAGEIQQLYYSNLKKYNTDKWSFYTNQTNLTDGIYNYKVYITDTAGNENETGQRTVTVDSTYPTIDFVAPTPGNNIHTVNNFVVVNISITEVNLDEFTWEWNDTNYTIYDDSLVLFMNFDNVSALGENSTLVKDLSGYGNDGVVQGNVDLTGPSRYGGAFKFDATATSELVNITNDQTFNFTNKSFTISHWTYTNYYYNWAGVVGKYKSLSDYVTGWEGSGNQGFRLYIGNGSHNQYVTNSTIPDFEWTHFAAVYNFSNTASERTIKLYINGILDISYSGVAIPTITGSNLFIGKDGEGGGNWFNGSIDDVMIWNRSLSSSEIQQAYFSHLSKLDTNKWSFYTNQSNLTDGSSVVYAAHAKDIAGNWNSTETRNITIDTTYPTIDFVDPTPANQTITSNNRVVVNVSMTELNLANFTWEWDGTKYTIYDDSLVLFMNFDNVSALGENSTLVKDLSEYGNDGVVNYNTSWNSTGGKYGGSYKFDGDTSDYPYGNEIIVSDDDSLNINASESGLTVVMWARIDDVSNGKWFLSKGTLLFRTQLSPQWQYSCSMGWQVIAAPVQEGNWTHIAITANESGVTVYENGRKGWFIEGDKCTTITSKNLYIGGAAVDGHIMNGSIDDLMIFNRSLSAAEIQQLYFSNLRKYDTDKWTFFTNQTNLTDGAYNYNAYITDTAGNENETGQRTITVDTTTPTEDTAAIDESRRGGMCIAQWDCSEWSECSRERTQTRECVHVGTCFILDNKPAEVRECEYAPKIQESCYDGIKNQNEEEIDCGGMCKPCAIEMPSPEKLTLKRILFGLLAIVLGSSIVLLITSIMSKASLNTINILINEARDALSSSDMQKAKDAYIEIMRHYNSLEDDKKKKVYKAIKELYEDRKRLTNRLQ